MNDLMMMKIIRRKRWFEGPSGEAERNHKIFVSTRLEQIEKTNSAILHLLPRILDLLEKLLEEREVNRAKADYHLSAALNCHDLRHLREENK